MTTAVQKAPRITQDEAARITFDLYRLNMTAAPLPSERDQNFLLRGTSQKERPAPSESVERNDQFVLKIANADEAIEFLELQNQLIRFLTASKIELEFPRIVSTRSGDDIATIKDRNGREHFVRLFTWLDGTCFAKAEPHDRKLLAAPQ